MTCKKCSSNHRHCFHCSVCLAQYQTFSPSPFYCAAVCGDKSCLHLLIEALDTLITPYSCVFSHNNLALSCKDSRVCDLYVSMRNKEEAELEQSQLGGAAAAVRFSCPPRSHAAVCVISVHLLILTLLPNQCLLKHRPCIALY